ncbi:hypothetical protein VNO77_20491 [Canavalia gladiata]|uniref:DUF674 family protein n=1 Tax=Canavalia gladiata TaxID=3824 RepID=A0AAN9LQ86_CANGL
MASSASGEKISVRVLVDEKKKKVVFVEAGKDFVDALLSFLTLPLGTVVRLVGKESNTPKISVGGLSSLYESVANIEEKYFWADTCVEMLLQPRNPMENYCQSLKLNIDDTERTKYFVCGCCTKNYMLNFLSTFRNKICCHCGRPMNQEMFRPSSPPNGGFVSERASFIISDELKVMPYNFQISLLSMNLGFEDLDAIKVLTMDVTRKEILDILKCCLLSTTPLTDVLLLKKQLNENVVAKSIKDFNTGEVECNGVDDKMMKIKVLLRKSDQSCRTLVERELWADLDCDVKEMLVKSPLAHQFKIKNQILPIDEVPASNYTRSFNSNVMGNATSFYSSTIKRSGIVPLSYLEPQSATGTIAQVYSNVGGRGFVKDSIFVVTNDLVVVPSSFAFVIFFLVHLNIPPSDLEERVISIGKKEGLSLLKASLVSSATLTSGLSPFLQFTKEEK